MIQFDISDSTFRIGGESVLVSDKIFTLLKERGMTQKEFAIRTGIAESTISDWKRKGLNPSLDKVSAICVALDITPYELLDMEEKLPMPDFVVELTEDEQVLLENFRRVGSEQQKRVLSYFTEISADEEILTELVNTERPLSGEKDAVTQGEVVEADIEFTIRKELCRRIRKLARLERIVLDESEHITGRNLHLLQYLDYLKMDKLDFVKDYLRHLQPFMITEMDSQERFDNAICILDEYYRISLYIKVNATRGEEVIVSFHENHKNGIAKRNALVHRGNQVYVFADAIGSHVVGTDHYSIDLFMVRGVRSFHINVPATRYDEDGFMVRYQAINSAWMDIMSQYLEDLYTSDLDFSEVELFTSLQQLSFTSYGNDAFSNISLLMDSLIIQKDGNSRQIADAALCIYCSSLTLNPTDKGELIDALRLRFEVNSVRVLPQVLERIEINIKQG